MQPLYQLPYNDLPEFISSTQLQEHYKLYQNYYNQTTTLPQQLNGLGTASPASMRGIQKTLQYALSGRDLHELYFGGMQPQPSDFSQISPKLTDLINASFGSTESWKTDFTACAMAARGWAALELDLKNNRLYNVVSDLHDEGFSCAFPIILVLDMYEHAYFYDYQTRKADYIAIWWQHISWPEINSRLEKVVF